MLSIEIEKKTQEVPKGCNVMLFDADFHLLCNWRYRISEYSMFNNCRDSASTMLMCYTWQEQQQQQQQKFSPCNNIDARFDRFNINFAPITIAHKSLTQIVNMA